MNLSKLQPPVLWMPSAALGTVQGAFTLSWVIYSAQLPTLLEKTKLTAAFTPSLLLIEAIIAIALEPIMGSFADRLEKQNRRFQLIWVGVVLSALLFLLLALLNQAGPFQLVPGMLIAWAIAMSIFRAPALALLRRYAFAPNLPQAASFLTLAAGLAGAARPLATPLITQLGVPLSFGLCSILLIVATFGLSAIHPSTTQPPSPRSLAPLLPAPNMPARYGLIAILGISVTLAFRLAIETLPKILKAALPQVQPPTIVGWVFIAVALTAIPAGLIASRIGNRRTMAIGLVGMIVALGLLPFMSSVGMAIVLAVLFGAAFSLVSNGTLPLALTLIPFDAAGFSVGLFFGGAAIATSLFLFFSGSFATPSFAITVGMVAIVVTAVCIALSHRLRQPELIPEISGVVSRSGK